VCSFAYYTHVLRLHRHSAEPPMLVASRMSNIAHGAVIFLKAPTTLFSN
jgi:hypothetical protein